MAGEDGPNFPQVSGGHSCAELQEAEACGGGGGSAQDRSCISAVPSGSPEAFLKWNSSQKTRQRRQSCCHVAPLVFDISRASGGAAPPGLVRLCQHRGPRFNKIVVSN